MLPAGDHGWLYTIEGDISHSSRGASNLPITPENSGGDRRLRALLLSRIGQLSPPDIDLRADPPGRSPSSTKGYMYSDYSRDDGALGKLSPPTSSLTFGSSAQFRDANQFAGHNNFVQFNPGTEDFAAKKGGGDFLQFIPEAKRKQKAESRDKPPTFRRRPVRLKPYHPKGSDSDSEGRARKAVLNESVDTLQGSSDTLRASVVDTPTTRSTETIYASAESSIEVLIEDAEKSVSSCSRFRNEVASRGRVDLNGRADTMHGSADTFNASAESFIEMAIEDVEKNSSSGCRSRNEFSASSSSGSSITSSSDVRTIPNEPIVVEVVKPGTCGGDAAKSGTDSGGAAKPTRRHSLGATPVPPRQQRRRLAAGSDPATWQKKGKPFQRRNSLDGPPKPNRNKENQPSTGAEGSATSLSSTLSAEDYKALLEKLDGKGFNPRAAASHSVSPNAIRQKLQLSGLSAMRSSAPSRMNRIRSPRRKEYERNRSAFRGKQASALKENISISTLVQHLAIDSLEDMGASVPPFPLQHINKSHRSQRIPPLPPIDPNARTVRTSNRTLDNFPPLSGSNAIPSSPWGRAKAKASIGRLPLSPSSSSDSLNCPIPERRAYWLGLDSKSSSSSDQQSTTAGGTGLLSPRRRNLIQGVVSSSQSEHSSSLSSTSRCSSSRASSGSTASTTEYVIHPRATLARSIISTTRQMTSTSETTLTSAPVSLETPQCIVERPNPPQQKQGIRHPPFQGQSLVLQQEVSQCSFGLRAPPSAYDKKVAATPSSSSSAHAEDASESSEDSNFAKHARPAGMMDKEKKSRLPPPPLPVAGGSVHSRPDKSASQRSSVSKAFGLRPVAEATVTVTVTATPPQPKGSRGGGIWEKLQEEKKRQGKVRARIQSASNQRAAASPPGHSTVQA